jgi:hypothetical protein
VAPYDPSVLPNELERNGLQKILEKDEHHQNAGGGNIEFSPEYMQAAEPHGIFDYADIWEEEIKPEQKKLCRGGTITGVAAQMAMIMGAKELHLYGCSFGDTGNGHYGYDHKGEPGGILNTHPVVMDYILSKIRDYGVDIYAHGPTNLRVPRVLKK